MQDLYEIHRTTATAERSPSKTSGLRYDNLYGGVAVEYEWSMANARREHGADQALGYLSELRMEVGDDEAFTAVVFDGKQWGFLAIDPRTEQTLFESVPQTKAEHFDWVKNDVSSCRRFLELVGSHRKRPVTNSALESAFGPASILTRQLVSLFAEGLAGRSQDDRADVLYREWRRALDVVYGDLDHPDANLAGVVSSTYGIESISGVGESLFVLHSYFAFVARLFAFEILGIATDDRNARPSSWVALPESELLGRLADLDDGRLPGGLVIHNLFEPDVFSWWVHQVAGNFDLVDAVRGILSTLADFAFPRVVHGPQRATDVLSGLYQALVGRQLRKKLGEFLTPRWLAEASLNRLTELGAPLRNGRVLDPTCGTGTFLIPILNDRVARLRGKSATGSVDAEAVQKVLDSIAGIDINPVAVIATRVNMVLALGQFAGIGDLTIPVWRADSLLVPDAPPRQGRTTDGLLAGLEFRELKTSLPDSFPVPTLISTSDRMEELHRALEYGLAEQEVEDGAKFIRESLTVRFGPAGSQPITSNAKKWEDDLLVAEILFRRIRKLSDEGRNGVWAQIIANAYAPLFAGKFDVVVGNPPWLAWGRLPSQWRAGSEHLWKKYGLWKLPPESGDNGGVFQVSDLCQLVFAIAIERYAQPGTGWIGLLTPQSLLIANPGARAFRRCRLESDKSFEGDKVDIPFNLVSVDDWSEVQPFAPLASNKPVFLIARRDQIQVFPISGRRWTRALERTSIDGGWNQARRLLVETEGTFSPANPSVVTSAWSFRRTGAPEMLVGGENQWDFGIGLHTRGANGVFFVKVLSADKSTSKVEIENIASEGRNAQVRVRRSRIEADVVYPLLRGKDVQPWRAIPSLHCVIPHDPSSFDQVLSRSRLAPGGDHAATGAWLKLHKPVLSERKAPPTRNWKMDGDDWCRIEGPLAHMRGKHLVVVREISGKPAAAIVEKRFDSNLGRSELPVIDHKLMFQSVASREEAIYLVGFINSTPAQDFLASFANAVGVTPKALKTLPIPPFDSNNASIQSIVDAGQQIMSKRAGPDRDLAIKIHESVIDGAVLELAQIDPSSYRPQVAVKPTRRRKKDVISESPKLFESN